MMIYKGDSSMKKSYKTEKAVSLRRVNDMQQDLAEYNKFLDSIANELIMIYEGNPYCAEFKLNIQLKDANMKLIEALENYKDALVEYANWNIE